jgi:hypothetical protein
MTIKAKPILKNRFWLIENEGIRIGTLSWNEEKYMFSNPRETVFFDTKKQINKKFGSDIEWTKLLNNTKQENSVNGYPTSVSPFNSMYDVKKKLPLFTKSKKSKSVYCAGYFIIKFDKGWVRSFCPKLITVERYPSQGPFKTETEMRQEFKKCQSSQ